MTEVKYQRPVCRGSYALGTACGCCERCQEERGSLNEVARAMFVVERRDGKVFCSYDLRVSWRHGRPYVALRGRRMGDAEEKIPMDEVNGIYCAMRGTEDEKERALDAALKAP